MALPTASDNAFPSVLVTEGTVPASPAAGKQRVYIDSTSHKLKRVNSSGVATDIESAGAGALVFLAAQTAAASASLDFTTFISSTYDTYKIEGVELILATNTADLRIEMGTGGGPTWDTGNNYEWAMVGRATDGTSQTDNGSTGLARVFKSIANAAGYGFGTFSLTASGLQSTAIRKTLHGTVEYVSSVPQATYGMFGMQWTTAATAVTGLRFIASAGNITSGVIRIYGVSKS
jgi:hypothetical protein